MNTYNKGDLVGKFKIEYLREVAPKYYNKGQRLKQGEFRCSCGNLFIAIISIVKYGAKANCGCGANSNRQIHGLSRGKYYRSWINIKRRCFIKIHKAYKNYGGRGITLYKPWVHDFKAFYDYISKLPNFGVKGLTLDRINNNGNYEPGNLRWATKKEQQQNSRRYEYKFQK